MFVVIIVAAVIVVVVTEYAAKCEKATTNQKLKETS